MYRVKDNNSIFGGVCIGMAEYFNTDVTLVRILFVLLFFTPIPVGIAYLIFWAILPVKDSRIAHVNENFIESDIKNDLIMSNQTKNGNIIGGLILIALGIIFSFKTLFDINIFSYIKNLWPLVFIGLGAWIILKERDSNSNNDQNFNQSDSTSF